MKAIALLSLLFFSAAAVGVDDNPYASPTPIKNWESPPENEQVRMDELFERYRKTYKRIYSAWNPVRYIPPQWLAPTVSGVASVGVLGFGFSLAAIVPLLVAIPIIYQTYMVARAHYLSNSIRRLDVEPPADFYAMDGYFKEDCDSWTRGFLKH